MNDVQSLRHTVWECKYHVVWIPKYRRKALYHELKVYLGEVIRELARQRESKIEEGHLRSDHVHVLISIPPKYAVSQVAGYIKSNTGFKFPDDTVQSTAGGVPGISATWTTS